MTRVLHGAGLAALAIAMLASLLFGLVAGCDFLAMIFVSVSGHGSPRVLAEFLASGVIAVICFWLFYLIAEIK